MPGNTDSWSKIFRDVMSTETLRVQVGILESKGGSAKAGDSKLTLVELGAIHEFGSPEAHIPERSWLRSTFYVRRAAELDQKITAACKMVLQGRADATKVLNLLGAWAASECKNTITQNEADGYGPYGYPPLADATIAAKGSSVPLIDTGQMKNSITWAVVPASKVKL